MRLAHNSHKNGGLQDDRGGHRQHILVVEDDDAVRRLLRNVFEDEGYCVSDARGGAELFNCLRSKEVSLITLDLTLRHEDGLALARAVRAEYQVPIIMITAKSGDIDKVVGLELGADDYIAKPFNVREVTARVRAVLRRSAAPHNVQIDLSSEIYTFEDWELDVTGGELRQAFGTPVELTALEFKLLLTFVRRPSRVLSRDTLLDLIGGADADTLERAVDSTVARLRKKIESDTSKPRLIKTVRGSGYLFTPRVTRVST